MKSTAVVRPRALDPLLVASVSAALILGSLAILAAVIVGRL